MPGDFPKSDVPLPKSKVSSVYSSSGEGEHRWLINYHATGTSGRQDYVRTLKRAGFTVFQTTGLGVTYRKGRYGKYLVEVDSPAGGWVLDVKFIPTSKRGGLSPEEYPKSDLPLPGGKTAAASSSTFHDKKRWDFAYNANGPYARQDYVNELKDAGFTTVHTDPTSVVLANYKYVVSVSAPNPNDASTWSIVVVLGSFAEVGAPSPKPGP